MRTQYLVGKLSLNKNLTLKLLLLFFIGLFLFLAPKYYDLNVSAAYCPYVDSLGSCSGDSSKWCCEIGQGYKDYASAPFPLGPGSDWGTYVAYKFSSGGPACNNGCYKCKGGGVDPTNPPTGGGLSCGEKDLELLEVL